MGTVPHLLPLTGAWKTVSQTATPGSEHLFPPTNDREGTSSIPQERQGCTIILLDYIPPDQLRTFLNPKWVQSWNVGADPYLAPGVLSEGVRLTSAMGTYSPTVSEHMLVILLAIYKRLPAYRDQQRTHTWADLGPVGSLIGKTVLVGGAGDISRHFVRLIHALGTRRVIGLRRNTGCLVEDFDEIYSLGALDGLLLQADVVALALPHTPETVGLMSKARLLAVRPDVVLLNAGRGNTVDCTVLAEVLCFGRLLGAGLDVTDPESLPPGHLPWKAPNPLLAPHTVGGYNHTEAMPERIRTIFLDNLRRYVEGRTPRNQAH